MTLNELAALIAGDAEASAKFAAGNDSGCAARCSSIADPVTVSTFFTYLGLSAIDPTMTRRLIVSMKTVAAVDPVVELIDQCFRGYNAASKVDGVDISLLSPLLTGLVAAAVPNGLLQADIETITNLSRRQPEITAGMVSATRNL